jgi:quinone-modifying oxidoreductase subunit QmoA
MPNLYFLHRHRAPGQRYEKFYQTIKEDENVFFIKGKVAEVSRRSRNKAVTVIAENAVTGEKIQTDGGSGGPGHGYAADSRQYKTSGDLKYTKTASSSMISEKGGMFAAGSAQQTRGRGIIQPECDRYGLKAIQTLARK